MGAEMMDVLLVEPEKFPQRVQMENSLEALQKAVGGNIEAAYFFNDPVAVIANEEGKIDGLPLNRSVYGSDGQALDIMAGMFLVVGLTEDDFGSLTEEQMQKYEERFHSPERFMMTMDGIRVFRVPDEDVRKQMEKGQKCAAPKTRNHEECL